MSMEESLDQLRAQHAELEAAIEKENARPHPDDFEIAQMKKQKLAIKDRLAEHQGA